MTDDLENQPTKNEHPHSTKCDITRRDFTALAVGAGLAATTKLRSAEAAGVDLIETDVEIKTPDGTCDAAFIHAKSGSYPGVLVWPDAFGLRPSMRAIGRRIAAVRIFRPCAQSLLSRIQGSIHRCLDLQLSES